MLPSNVTAHSGTEGRTALRGGAIAGAIGAVVMSCWLVGVAAFRGRDAWVPLQRPAIALLGGDAITSGIDARALLLGQVVHVAISIVWAVLFAELVIGASRRATLALGAIWGVVVWVVMTWVALPLARLGDLARLPSSPAAAALAHVVWGLAVALAFLPFQHPRHRPLAFRLPGLWIPRVWGEEREPSRPDQRP